jgi:hypothetical protein
MSGNEGPADTIMRVARKRVRDMGDLLSEALEREETEM